MAKSKLVKINKSIASLAHIGFDAIRDNVMDGYEHVEKPFVDRYLTEEDETVEEAQRRLKAEQTERKAEQERGRARRRVTTEKRHHSH
ncbi:hypothetical protein GA0061078_0383 [Bifidobacterium bohemicum]|uniref:Uncharacterized protein n=1 Tax=Bifidobacterium bohemicum DSM 22767 TaxID=1437606 RepID=A0A086ZJD1_9BIFI|nr:hypothetical protein [Bifidobacterium bohemicum]KFI46631.1 hypothetical protein BBOH_0103 [Bifidobacterium bohemicum DSM 22767]SCB77251.1 hypothetical protein GA0061078_0383 [Bifidobacterium bohemicum]